MLPRIRWGEVSDGQTGDRGIRWTEHVNSIDADLSGWHGKILEFAFAANPGLHVCVDSTCNPVGSSSDGLIRVDIPPGTRRVRLYYRNPLFLPSICIALATLVLMSIPVFRMRSVQIRNMQLESPCVT